MARTSDALQRDQLQVVASGPRARVQAPVSNSALQLADALAKVTPEARQVLAGVAEDKARQARSRAERDALVANGRGLADAVREGVIAPTQNPWYITAYNRESASIRARTSLQQLQLESATWDEVDDYEAFTARWNQEVGELAKGYEDPDSIAGFQASEATVTPQVLQTNISRNSSRIVAERKANVGMLSSDAITQTLRAKGGTLTPNEAWDALLPMYQQWKETGGDDLGWREIVVDAVTTAANEASDKYLLDLLKAPELIYGPSEAGDSYRIGSGALGGEEYSAPVARELTFEERFDAEFGGVRPEDTAVAIPVQQGFTLALPVEGRVSSAYGPRKAPMAEASSNHGGMDIAAPAGTPIKAQAHGRVIAASKQGGLGNAVTVDYGNGVVATYGHMKDFSVKEGDIVSPGQSLGGVGRTGTATGNHVHYALKVNGKSVDPAKFNGQIGGTEFTQQGAGQVPSYPGFPTGEPYTPGQKPPNMLHQGPSLYGMPGMADQIEQSRYLIGQRADLASTERLRKETQRRNEEAFSLRDRLYAQFGTAILTGGVTRSQMLQKLGEWGVPAPVIAQTLNLVGDDLSSSSQVANAQTTALGQNPAIANRLSDLFVEAATSGYSDAFDDKVAGMVTDGVLDAGAATSLLRTALARSEQLTNQAEADQAKDEAKAKGRKVDSAVKLNESVDNALALAVKQFNLAGAPVTEEGLADLKTHLLTVARGHLATAPGDYEGAYALMVQARDNYLYPLLQAASEARYKAGKQGTKKPAAPTGNSNPRR